MITPEQAAAMAPVLQGVINGYITEFEKSPEPYMLRCGDLIPAPQDEANPYADRNIYVTGLFGTMMKYDSCGDAGTRSIGRELLKADADESVIGHIIVADSGGGSTSSVAEIADAILACKKPVVALVDGTAGSACYYAITYCDRILAHQEMDVVGCIGTLIQLSGYPKFRKDSDGWVSARIYADEAGEKNADYEAALEGNFQVIKDQTLNPINDRFIADVRANRPAVQDEQLHGRTFFAKDVVGTMIDSIGSLEEAAAAVMELSAAREASPDNSITSQMKQNQYKHLESMPAFEGQVFDTDGTTTLQPAQLEAVEAVLAREAEQQDTINGLQQQLDTANSQLQERDNRIAELEQSLAAAQERLDNPTPESPKVEHQPEGAGSVKTAQDWEAAMEICNDFLKK